MITDVRISIMKVSPIQSNLEDARWLTENLPIRLFGDPVLIGPCEKVTKAEIKNGEAKKWADQLVNFLQAYRKKTGGGRGLAANQIGVTKCMLLVWLDDGPQIYINPKIISTEGKGVYPESCISVASLIMGDVTRPWTGTFEYTDLDGKNKKIEADPIHTRLLLHEIDHLDGIVCSDKYTPGTTRIVSGGAEEVLKPELKKVT